MKLFNYSKVALFIAFTLSNFKVEAQITTLEENEIDKILNKYIKQ